MKQMMSYIALEDSTPRVASSWTWAAERPPPLSFCKA